MKLVLITVLAFSLAGCEAQATSDNPTLTSSAPGAVAATIAREQPTGSGSASTADAEFEAGIRRLAASWNVDGVARCGFYAIGYIAQTVRQNDQAGLRTARGMMAVLGKVKPLVDPTPGGSLVNGAFKVYEAKHQYESSPQVSAGLNRCAVEITTAVPT